MNYFSIFVTLITLQLGTNFVVSKTISQQFVVHVKKYYLQHTHFPQIKIFESLFIVSSIQES